MNKVKKQIFLLLIFFWIILSIFDVFYNLIKFFPEARQWIFLSDSQKRVLVYGPIYNFLSFVDKYTNPNTSILIYSKDDKAYYLGRYMLYPKNITVVVNTQQLIKEASNRKFNYVALNDYSTKLVDYKAIATVSSGILYKKL